MKLRRILFIIVILLTFSGCLSVGTLKSIKILGDQNIDVNEEVRYTVETTPQKVTADILWSSSDPYVVTVSEDGIVKGKNTGAAVITAASQEFPEIKDEISVFVSEPVIESITVTGSNIVYLDTDITLSVTVKPLHASQKAIFLSSDSQIASVDENGVVHGEATGMAVITVKSSADPSVTQDFPISVEYPVIDSISLLGPAQLETGDQATYQALAGSININQLVIWSSTNPEIATVTLGHVEAVSAGTVTIRAEYKDDSSIFSEITLTVIKTDYRYYQTKILLLDTEQRKMELLDCPAVTYASDIKVLKKDGEDVTTGSVSDLYVGMENVYAKVNLDTLTITQILIDGVTGFSHIRVAIHYSINDISQDQTLYHDNPQFTFNAPGTIRAYDGSGAAEVSGNTKVTIRIVNGKMVAETGTGTLFTTEKRMILTNDATKDGFTFNSITRGSSRLYSGNIEVTMVNGRLLVVNDIDIEQYLYKVIPSEMPSSYHPEALKAQAIAARTYAYRDIYNRTYEKLGYTVDDSTRSQVYNNINEQATTNAAVNATKGLVMMYNGELVSAFYYSTSSGLTASAHEVWISDGFQDPEPIPYLIGKNLTKDTNGNVPQFDFRNEASMLAFFKNTSYTAPDSNISPYYRWNVTFTKAQLALTLQKNLQLMYASTPELILTQTSNGWASLPIPSEIGTVNDIYVDRRGESGVVMSLIVETSSGTYKIVNQYNIRFTIRPKDAGVNDNSILFSGFFAIEQNGDSYTFYGGGNGHGVGMSQNGANSLGKSEYGFQEILTTYYSDIQLINITYDYLYLKEFKQYFQ